MTLGPEAMLERARSTLATWRDWAEELRPRELALKESMHPDVRNITDRKPLLLFQRILTMLGVPKAKQLVDQMTAGFKVVGEWQPTGIFPRKEVVASKCLKDIFLTAPAAQDAVCNMRAGAEEHDREVWAETMDELQRGVLKGTVHFGGGQKSE